jgi:integrase
MAAPNTGVAEMGVRSGDHIKWRGGIAHYRRVVPADCRPAYGKWEETQSLGTRSETEARRLEKRQDAQFEDRIRAIREARNPDTVAARIKSEIRLTDGGTTLKGAFSTWNRVLEADIAPADALAAHTDIIDHIHALLEQSVELQSLFREIGDVFSRPVSPERLKQFREAMSAIATAIPDKAALPSVPGYCTFGTIFEKWEDEMKPASKTVYSWKKIVGKLVAHLQQVRSVTEDEMMAWNAACVTEYDVIAWKDSLVASGLDPTTIKNHLTILRTIYNYAAANKHVAVDVSDGVKAVKFRAKKKPGTRRLGYTDAEAAMILSMARQTRDPVLRWSPWLAAALGTRIDEICGAMTADIEIDRDGVPWFRVRLDYRETDPEQDPELKSENAERMIPIHSALREEGFFHYLHGLPKNGPLFPDLKPDRFGRRGGNGSKRVQRWVRNKVKIIDKRKAPSHSWRHRFRSILRNPKYGISEDVADYMSGHGGSGGEGRDYGAYRDAMVEAIRRLPSPLPVVSAAAA